MKLVNDANHVGVDSYQIALMTLTFSILELSRNFAKTVVQSDGTVWKYEQYTFTKFLSQMRESKVP